MELTDPPVQEIVQEALQSSGVRPIEELKKQIKDISDTVD